MATSRTLENKISDAGPNPQRIDPHILTQAKGEMVDEGIIAKFASKNTPWFHLPTTPAAQVNARLKQQEPIHIAMQERNFGQRAGQALEIAVFRALRDQTPLTFMEDFLDLDEHDDSTLYSKTEMPAVRGRRLPGRSRLDFVVVHASAGVAGIECKNVREWMYPQRDAVHDLIHKCCAIDAVPVLIARRISYATFSVLNKCGVLIHQNYNQLFPTADRELAMQAADKTLLGYHDVRIGNEPNDRLKKFIQQDLPDLLPGARQRFAEYRDLLCQYGDHSMSYEEFAGRAGRRDRGEPEDGFPEDQQNY